MNKRLRLVLVVSILASSIAFLDGSIINVALPAITKELGGGLTVQQWVVDSYLITLGALILIAGSLSDLFGRIKIMSLGLIGFGVTSLLCAVAPSGVFLVIMRAFQGAAGALLVPSSLALIMSEFTPPTEGKAIGQWTAWTSIGVILGPLLGGFLVSTLSWRLIFAVNILPIAVTLWLLAKLHSQKQLERPKERVDIVGAVLGALGLGGIAFALIEQSNYGWASPAIFVPLILSIIILVTFIFYEKYTTSPMLPLSLFKIRNFGVGNAATFAIYAGLSLVSFLVTIFVQQLGKFSALEAGLALMPITIIMFLLSSRFGVLSSKYGPRFFMTAGPAIAAIGFLLMLRVSLPIDYVSQLLPGILVFALGLSITVAPLTSAILGAVSSGRSGVASAINNAVARIAGLVAVAAIGIVTGPVLTRDGFYKGIIIMAGLLFAGAIISFLGIQNPKKI